MRRIRRGIEGAGTAEISRLLARRAGHAQADARRRPARLTRTGPRCYASGVNALRQFLDILLKPDNIPIAGMLVLVFFFTWVALRQALRNDRLAEEGREDEILRKMQE